MSSPAEVVILVPVLKRPHNAAPLVESITAATPERHRVLFIGTPDDRDEHDACRATGADLITIDIHPSNGDYARKINAGYRASTEPLLLIAADDLRFHPHWLERAVERLTPGIGVVGTNDLGNPRVLAGEHTTHPLVTREYVDRFGTIDEAGKVYCEEYPHEYSDDEFVGTAKFRRAWAFAADSIVEHLHPNWGKAPTDELYDAQRSRQRRGRMVYQRRQHLWT